MSQPTISHHLGILKQFKLVTSRKEGKLVFYDINRDNLVECCGRLMAKFDAEEACEALTPLFLLQRIDVCKYLYRKGDEMMSEI